MEPQRGAKRSRQKCHISAQSRSPSAGRHTRPLVGGVLIGLLAISCSGLVVVFVSGASSSTTSSSSATSASPSSSSTSGQRQALGLSATAAAARQSAASVLGALGSIVPGLITNVAPLVLLFGLGAMLMPALTSLNAMGAMRSAATTLDSRRSGAQADQFNPLAASLLFNQPQLARPIQSSPQDLYYFAGRSLDATATQQTSGGLPAALASGLHELLERVNRALENADKKYN